MNTTNFNEAQSAQTDETLAGQAERCVIRPCPFCGNTPELIEELDDESWDDYHVECECGAQVVKKGFGFINKYDAITAWNKRA